MAKNSDKLINCEETEKATRLLEPRRLSVFLMPLYIYAEVFCLKKT